MGLILFFFLHFGQIVSVLLKKNFLRGKKKKKSWGCLKQTDRKQKVRKEIV